MGFALIGALAIIITSAASSSIIEPEEGVIAGGANIVDDSSASNAKAVSFNAPAGGGTVTIPNPGSWTNLTGNMAGMSASCGNFGGIWPVPSSSSLIAGVGQINLFKSGNGGNAWTALGGSGPKVANRVGVILYDPANANTFYEAGIYGGGGVFKTTDGGATFRQLGSINHNDAVAVDFSDASRQTLLAGGHEQSQTLYKSTDGGSSWTQVGGSLPSNSGFSSYPVIINSNTYLIGVNGSWSGKPGGVWRTINGGASWTQQTSMSPTSPVLTASNGTLYYPTGNSLMRSTDNGASWVQVGNNLKSEVRPIELPDGKLVTANTNNRLVYSSNSGSSWTEFGPSIPYANSAPAAGGYAGVAYSAANDAFYIWHWDCGNSVLSDAVMRLK